MITIGITGPTGAGKTTALQELKQLGGCVLDADALYHQMLAEDAALQADLERRFGPLRNEAGQVDRKKLGAIVFADPAALDDLNAITRRYLDRAMGDWLAQAAREGYPVAAIDAIRLLENGLDQLCGVTLAITAPAEVRVRRIMDREGISEEYAWSRVRAQRPDAFYADRCDHLLVNDCASAEAFGARAKALLEQILDGVSEPHQTDSCGN